MRMQMITYQTCEYIVAETVQPNGFFNQGQWLIHEDKDVIAALESLKKPLVCPATLIFAPTRNLSQNNCFDDLVFIVKRKQCALQIVSSRFHQPNSPSDEMDSLCRKLLLEFGNSNIKGTLTEYAGSLSQEEVLRLRSPSTLTSLGLVVASSQDIETLAVVISQKNWRWKNVIAIHLSIARSLLPEDFEPLQKMCPARLCLKFFSLADGDVNWMVNLTLALDKPFTKSHVCVDEISLIKSQLSLKGVEEMLKTFKIRDQRLAYPVVIESSAIHEVVKDTLSEETNEGIGPRLYFKGSVKSAPHNSEKKSLDRVHAFKEAPKEYSPLRKDELVAGIVMICMIQFSFFFGVWFKFT